MNITNYISENYEGDETIFDDRNGDVVVSSYILLLVGLKASGFDGLAVINSLDKENNRLAD